MCFVDFISHPNVCNWVAGGVNSVPPRRCGAFGAFESYIATREEADVRLAREGVLHVGQGDSDSSSGPADEWHHGT